MSASIARLKLRSPRAFRAARLLALAALACDLASLSYHLATGHGPGSPNALSVPAFLLEHEAFAVAAVLALAAFALATPGSARSIT